MTVTHTLVREFEADLVVARVEKVAHDVVAVALTRPDGEALPTGPRALTSISFLTTASPGSTRCAVGRAIPTVGVSLSCAVRTAAVAPRPFTTSPRVRR
jgi:hypothetical protein